MAKERETGRFNPDYLAQLKERLPGGKMDALIVLDAGYVRNKKGEFKPTFETKMRLWAGGYLYSLRLAEKLILCGGRLYGPEYPPDSQVMKNYILQDYRFKSHFGLVPEEAIITEEKSRNTSENFQAIKEILEKHPKIEKIGVIGHWHHLFCGGKIAADILGIKPEFFNLEEALKARSPHYHPLINRYYTSWLTKPGSKEFRTGLFITIESLFRLGVLVFDQEGKSLSWLADRGITAGKLKKTSPR